MEVGGSSAAGGGGDEVAACPFCLDKSRLPGGPSQPQVLENALRNVLVRIGFLDPTTDADAGVDVASMAGPLCITCASFIRAVDNRRRKMDNGKVMSLLGALCNALRGGIARCDDHARNKTRWDILRQIMQFQRQLRSAEKSRKATSWDEEEEEEIDWERDSLYSEESDDGEGDPKPPRATSQAAMRVKEAQPGSSVSVGPSGGVPAAAGPSGSVGGPKASTTKLTGVYRLFWDWENAKLGKP